MTRLTNPIRERMVKDLLDRRFRPQGLELAATSAQLFKTVYEDHFDQATRKLMVQIKRKVRGAFDHHRIINCRAGGLSLDIGAVRLGNEGTIFIADIEPQPFVGSRDRAAWSYTDCQIGIALQDFATAQAAFTATIKNARTELTSALNTVTTDRQLADLWPEAMPILGKHVPVASGNNLPAVQFSKLTESFGLAGTVGA